MSGYGRPPMGRNRLLHFLSFVDWNSNAWLASQLDAGWWNTLNDGEMSTMLAWAQTVARYARGASVHTQALEVPAFLQAKETAVSPSALFLRPLTDDRPSAQLLAKEDARIPLTTEEDTELEVCNGLKTILREAHNQAGSAFALPPRMPANSRLVNRSTPRIAVSTRSELVRRASTARLG